ncbi:membrane protein [Halobacillus andaensis]|uniref:Membrane protein n=1 Tax=Halobacillus andaensis TaxID=1176239 RepID=A0A917B5X2_HALAA|nr:cytochrome c oxidase assembly protein [Halobacillus andaensis]MBP2005783.1 putative membrane protein [Halobacillus andaensis]GGF26080.1 membrane protein [Halobacillus andaensis]
MSHHHGDSSIAGGEFLFTQILLALPFIVGLVVYGTALYISKKKKREWSLSRSILWTVGSLLGLASVSGPLAQSALTDFTAHMAGHLLLGMLAPLLMVLAAPMTLVLRALPVKAAKRLTKLLRTWPVRIVTDPLVASLLNVGGLWLLYTTNVYALMHQSLWLHIFIHLHVFIAGYLFTVSMIYIDPVPHRKSYLYRAIVLIAALAGHGILSKYIYGSPPEGVPAEQAEAGGMLMYYGGDAIDLVIIFILCLHWYRAARPRTLKENTNYQTV